MCKKLFLLIAVIWIQVLGLSLPALAGLTVYCPYDRSFEPYIAVEPNLTIQWQGGVAGSHVIDYYGGQTGFNGALDSTPDAWSVYWGDTGAWEQTTNTTQGTIDMWIAPHWNGTNQGGSGVGGPGAWQYLINWKNGADWANQGVRIFIMNNGYPDDGGQLFAFWKDTDDAWRTFNCSDLQPNGDVNGTTTDWVADEWHHVAFCWDATTLGLYLDGGVVQQTDRPSSAHGFGDGFWVASYGNGTSGLKTWDGKIDDLGIWDEVRYTGTYTVPTGPLYDASAELKKAWLPTPATGISVDKVTGSTLSWNAGNDAVTHKVYWDPCEANVVNRTVTPITLSVATETTSTPTTPSIGTTYYWAVDEVDSVPSTTAGDLWQYTIDNWLIVDDMENYDLSGDPDTGNQIYDIWVDGYYGTSGSAVAAQPDGFEGTVKAMEYKYSNNGTSPYGPSGYPYYSEVVANTSDLDVGSDWTTEGIAWLQLNFKGLATNDANERMYVAIEDSTPNFAMVQYGLSDSYSNPEWAEDMNDIKQPVWDAYGWAIDLRSFTGVNLADVQKVYIGFGTRGNVTTPGGTGTVVFDEIRLIRPGVYRTVVPLNADLYDDGTVDFKDFAIVANEWLLIEDDGIWPVY